MGLTILLATYNGELYIKEQLNSILNQTYSDFCIVVQDDHSTDNTWTILQDYQKKYADKIKVIQQPHNSGGAKNNFLSLMISFKDDYLMLCDQDDVWLPDKIEKSLNKIKQMEATYGINTPCLVHSDLIVVNESLQVIHPSFRKMMNANYKKTALHQQIIQNTLTGCSSIYNRALSKLITVMPPYCVMHDWWLMLVAAAFGKIETLDIPTLYYRQHGKNEIGAKNVRSLKYKIEKLNHIPEIKTALQNTYLQANSLLKIYSDLLSDTQQDFLVEYCSIPNLNKIQRWQKIIKLDVLKNGVSRKIAHFLFI